MPQSPVESTLFVTQIVAGSGVTVSPESGTGIVTLTSSTLTEDFAAPPPLGDDTPNTVDATTLTASGKSTLHTTQVSGLTASALATFSGGLAATGNSLLTTTQVSTLTVTGLTTLGVVHTGALTATSITATANTLLVTTQVSALTATGLATLSGGAALSGGVTVTGNTTLATTQVSALTATGLMTLSAGVSVTGNSILSTTQVGSLAATHIAGATTFVANGATGVSVQIGGLTANSILAFGLKTVGGTVGNTPHAIFPPNTGTGVVVVAATALDTSTYNIAAIG